MGHKKQENTGWMGKLFLNDSDKKMPDTLKYKKFIMFFFTNLKNHIRLIEINSLRFLNKGQWQTTEHSFYYAMTSFRIQTWLLSLTDHEMMDQEKKPTLQMYKVILQISWSAVKNIPEKNSRKKVKLFINVKSSFSEKATKSPICFDASDYYYGFFFAIMYILQ